MNIIFALGHPAHYHLFKNVAAILMRNGHIVEYAITPKDILEDILKANNEQYTVLAQREHKQGMLSKLSKIRKSTRTLVQVAKEKKTDILVGCLSQIAFAGKLLGIPSIFVGEDDFAITWMQGLITYPFVNTILAPQTTNVGPFEGKRIAYPGYQKLAYLHPNYFRPDRSKIHFAENSRFFLLRASSLNAYHDGSASGLNDDLVRKLIKILEVEGHVCISSERPLPADLERYRFSGNKNDIHHYLYYADLFVGDSQSMAVESAMLGTPNIRFNAFVGRINVLNEIEGDYNLSIGIDSKDEATLIEVIRKTVSDPHSKQLFRNRLKNMILDKIDVSQFMAWFIENYPSSKKQAKSDINIFRNFK